MPGRVLTSSSQGSSPARMKSERLSDEDPGLYFNIGRLYIDWKRWEKVDEMASLALDINKGFTEAQKMRNFANKQLKKQEKAKKKA